MTEFNFNNVSASGMDIPRATDTDFSDPVAVLACHHLLTALLQANGGFAFPLQADGMTRRCMAEGRMWMAAVREAMNNLPAGCIPAVADAYDLMSGIITGGPTPESLTDGWRARALHAMAAGDPSVGKPAVAAMIQDAIARRRHIPDRRQLAWYCDITADWCDDLTRGGDSFRDVGTGENFRRMAVMLRAELRAILGRTQDSVKTRWAAATMTDDTRAMDPDTLRAYGYFLSRAAGYLPRGRHAAMRDRILADLATHPDTHPLDRRAYALDRQILSRISGTAAENEQF